MKLDFSAILKYTVSLALAIGLFVYLYRDRDMGSILEMFSKIDYRWVGVSFVVYVISHLSRGWRWSIMLEPLGYRTGVLSPFLAVMVGYLANFVLPRMGEVARCGILKKTDDVPVNISFGAVVAERVLDLVMLVIISIFTVFIEFEKLSALLQEMFDKSSQGFAAKMIALGVLAVAGLTGLALLYVFRKKLMAHPLYGKIAAFLLGLKDGLLSIARLDRNKRLWFLFHTVLIWVCYYFTSYALFFTTDLTSDLTLACALSVLVTSGLSMVIPVQGGIGVYHAFVGATLIVYGLDKSVSKDFTLLMHSTQMVVMIVLGLISLVWSLLLKSKKHEPVSAAYVS